MHVAIAHLHVRLFWGALDIDGLEATSPSYSGVTDYATLGPSATPGVGVGVRRLTLLMDRLSATPADDACLMHFDFLNITGGDPDDTWITSDFTTLEGLASTWFTGVKPYVPGWCKLSRYLWHRVGPGIPLPNPAVRIVDIASPQTGTGTVTLPPQAACSITLRTGLRRHWGRTYLPLQTTIDSTGRIGNTARTAIVAATVTFLQAAAAADFFPVVMAVNPPGFSSALGVEAVEVDDDVDIIRRRRWKHTVNRNVTSL